MTTPTTKTKRYIGNRYDFNLIYDPADRFFEIVAIHKESGRKSSITNLNYIIREVLEMVLGAEETLCMIDAWLNIKSKRKFKKLVLKARKYFRQVDSDLETALDDDMEQGGWNSEEDN